MSPGFAPAVFQYTITILSMATLSMAIALLWSTVAVVHLFVEQPLESGKFPSEMVILGQNGCDSSQIRGLVSSLGLTPLIPKITSAKVLPRYGRVA